MSNLHAAIIVPVLTHPTELVILWQVNLAVALINII